MSIPRHKDWTLVEAAGPRPDDDRNRPPLPEGDVDALARMRTLMAGSIEKTDATCHHTAKASIGQDGTLVRFKLPRSTAVLG